jgi:hypothetical protein
MSGVYPTVPEHRHCVRGSVDRRRRLVLLTPELLAELTVVYCIPHAAAQWLRHYATTRKVAGSRPDELMFSIYLMLPAALDPEPLRTAPQAPAWFAESLHWQAERDLCQATGCCCQSTRINCSSSCCVASMLWKRQQIRLQTACECAEVPSAEEEGCTTESGYCWTQLRCDDFAPVPLNF